MLNRVKDWIWGAPFRCKALTRLDLLLALVLSAFAEVIVSGAADKTDPQGGVLACASVLLMTLPVAVRRAHPLGAMAVFAGGAVFNAIAVGSYVRCGASAPVVGAGRLLGRCALRVAAGAGRSGARGRLDGGAGSQRSSAEARLLCPAVAF